MGIGFAIPSNMARLVVKSLIENGRVVRGWLGVSIQDLNEDLARSFKYQGTEGALVGQVQKGGPAEAFGIKSGDIILSVNGRAVANINQLKNIVATIAPKSSVPVELVREGKKRTISVTIGELPSQPEESFRSVTGESEDASSAVQSKIGVTFESLTPELSERLRSEKKAGAVITNVNPGSLGAQASLRPRDIIVNINGTNITSAKQVQELLTDEALKQGVRLVVETQGMERFVIIKAD
jgi:serine protease Do